MDDASGLCRHRHESRRGLADGTIDAIATDHAPHARYEKEREFDHASFGILGLETAFGLSYTSLVETGLLTLPQLVDRMSCAPARVLSVPGGTLSPGAQADVAVLDLTAEWTVDPTTFRSKSRNTPFAGFELRGRCDFTIVGGKVMEVHASR